MKKNIWIPCLVFLLIFTVLFSLTLGKYEINLREIFTFLSASAGFGSMDEGKYALFSNILLDIRLPRIVAAALIGSALSVSGAAFQAMFINPLVSPALLGVLAGASFGAALGMIVSSSWFAVQVSRLSLRFSGRSHRHGHCPALSRRPAVDADPRRDHQRSTVHLAPLHR